MKDAVETEVKISLPAGHSFPSALLSHGFQESAARVFERNTLFDTPDRGLKQRNEVLRIREAGAKFIVTWKGKGVGSGPHKSRPEIETAIESAKNLRQILNNLGFDAVFVYEKYRTEFQHDADGVVTYDETPIGEFLELEGNTTWIDATARVLGFAGGDYILESYVQLYLQHCKKQGVDPSNMQFPAAK
jgi:adenylate cyclase, class 2